MDSMCIKPARDGILLRNPATGEIIPPQGAAVTLGPYRAFWLRRIKDGDALAVATKEATDKDSNDALAVATKACPDWKIGEATDKDSNDALECASPASEKNRNAEPARIHHNV